MKKTVSAISPLMQRVSTYMSEAPKRALPKEVVEKGKHHILDTFAAIVSGSRLLPGIRGLSYVKKIPGLKEAGVIGSRFVTSAAHAALANGMSAHADETDDSHQPSNTHPGCGIVPAALAVAEREASDGKSMLRAVVLGYDIGTRITRSLRPMTMKTVGRVNHSIGNNFGAAAAAGALCRLNARQMRYLLSYAVQQASGIRTFERDTEHVLKAFLFAGMTAHNGVASATMVSCGFTGVDDDFTGKGNRNFFAAFSPDPVPEEMVNGLGSEYAIVNTNIKKWSVGTPVQSAIDALFLLMKEHAIGPNDVEKLVVHSPDDGAHIINISELPDVNIKYLLAVTLLDGTLTFAATHDPARMKEKKVMELRKRVEFVPSAELIAAKPPWQSIIEIFTKDARHVKHRTYSVKGRVDDPMTRAEVAEKALDLTAPVLGKARAQKLIETVWRLEKIADIRTLRPLLAAREA